MAMFLSTMAFLEGYPAPKAQAAARKIKPARERIDDRLSSTYFTAITRNWMVWPWVQIVNFSIVPLEHRVLVVNVVALGWNCYLSYLNSQGAAADNGDEQHQEKKED
jgi:protein Mpv17